MYDVLQLLFIAIIATVGLSYLLSVYLVFFRRVEEQSGENREKSAESE